MISYLQHLLSVVGYAHLNRSAYAIGNNNLTLRMFGGDMIHFPPGQKLFKDAADNCQFTGNILGSPFRKNKNIF